MTGEIDILTLTAALIGATSLIFAAKGNVWAQILMIFLLCTGREAKIEEKIEIG